MTRTLYDVTLPPDWTGPAPLTLRPAGGAGAYRFELGGSHTVAMSGDAAAALARDYPYTVEPVSGDRLRRVELEKLAPEVLAATYEELMDRKPGQRKPETMIEEMMEAEADAETPTDDTTSEEGS